MLGITDITAIEDRYVEQGEPSLGEAYIQWRARWDADQRDRETALHLMFLSWHACSEPPRLTGLDARSIAAWPTALGELYQQLGGEAAGDPETAAVVGWMSREFPWCCGEPFGDEAPDWESLGQRLGAISSSPLPPLCFAGRGAYGHYFSQVLRTGPWLRRD